MKLTPLLAQYLYNNKELQLTGIGKFVIDPGFHPPVENLKHQKAAIIPDISFHYDPTAKEDAGLIAFLSAETGKMKSLMAADLDSHLELARQFLNIGKPFMFEGIGTLVKTKAGSFEFTPGYMLTEKLKEPGIRDVDHTSTTEESFSDYEEMFSPKKPRIPAGKKLGITFIILAGIGLAVWGGYFVYKRSIDDKPVKEDTPQNQTVLVSDSSTITRDSIPANPASGLTHYKFILEESARDRAIRRFEQLKGYHLDIKMETQDSIRFKLYFMIPAMAADTLKIRDSLSLMYDSRVSIEY